MSLVVLNPDQVRLARYDPPRLTAAVNAIHQQLREAWTLEDLAKCAAQSRAQYAKTFRTVSGSTPMNI